MVQDSKKTQVENQQFADVYYVMDISRAELERRAFDLLLLGRRCPACRKRIEEKGALPPVKKQIEEIAECCALAEDFIRPDMPLREISFRLILKGTNRPISVKDLHYALTEEWARPTHPMNISASALKRILDNDRYYGFKQVGAETKR